MAAYGTSATSIGRLDWSAVVLMGDFQRGGFLSSLSAPARLSATQRVTMAIGRLFIYPTP
jgi:hypothetical protein